MLSLRAGGMFFPNQNFKGGDEALTSRGREPLYVRFEATGPNGVVWKRGLGLGLGPEPPHRTVPDGQGGQAFEFDAAPARSSR